MRENPSTPGSQTPRLLGVLLAAAALGAYHNSFSGPFVFDDVPTILENPTIRQLWPLGPVLSPPNTLGLTVNGRPLVNLSLALNYALGGLDVRGYHAFNLLVHFLCGLTLFGLVRRVLARGEIASSPWPASLLSATAVAVLWVVHPLQTAAITYTVQRAEALVSLFYLLTFYAFVRAATRHPSEEKLIGAPAHRGWLAVSAVACALGMATKEVMVSAPVLVLLFDRAFIAGSFAAAWRARRVYYLALAATWGLLAWLMIHSGGRGGTAGFGLGIPWWQYALTQCGAVVHYLRLAFWPTPLVFDYGGDVLVENLAAVWPQALLLAALVAATIITLVRRPKLGFLGAWFFALLAPTSSIVPLADTIFEHRVYLALAAIITGWVLALRLLIPRWTLPVCGLLTAALGLASVHRNETYRTEISLWRDTVAHRPASVRARYTLGSALGTAGRTDEAVVELNAALALKPDSAPAHINLGNILANHGRANEAIKHYEAALQAAPSADGHNNLGTVFSQLGRYAEARAHYEAALRMRPDFAGAHNNLGNLAARAGDFPDARIHYEAALQLRPDNADAHANLANVLAQTGHPTEALAHYEAALRLRPNFADAHFNLALTLAGLGRLPEAAAHWETVLQLRPDYPNAANLLARARSSQSTSGR